MGRLCQYRMHFHLLEQLCLGALPPPLTYPRIADLHHFNAVPDLGPTFHLNPDPDAHQSDANLWLLVERPSRAPLCVSKAIKC
jgi:hypothetical protein